MKALANSAPTCFGCLRTGLKEGTRPIGGVCHDRRSYVPILMPDGWLPRWNSLEARPTS